MSIQQTFEPQDGYLLVCGEGSISLEALTDAYRELIEYCLREHHLRVLIDARACTGQLDPIGFVHLGERLSGMGIEQIDRIAVISHEDRSGTPDNEFGETATRNRGANLLLFDDETSAVAWLKSSE